MQATQRRWSTAEGEQLVKEIVGRLVRGRSLDDLRLPTHDGRIDLRGLPVAHPKVTSRLRFRTLRIEKLDEALHFRKVALQNLDLSAAVLESVGFSGTTIVNCRFDGARCRHWRVWEARVEDSGFVGTDLRSSFLGRWHEGRESAYRHVDFTRADLRDASVSAASFIDCDFSNAKLVKIDFQSSNFIRCRFAGLLEEVIFWDHGYKTGKPDANPMQDVDFSKAKLRWVEFRRLNLERVRLPADEDHVVVRHYRCVLEKALQELSQDDRVMTRGLKAVLENNLRWIGPSQDVGIFNRRDLGEYGREEERFAVSLLRRLEEECAAVDKAGAQ